MIIYLLTFYLIVDIKNIFRITHAKHSSASKAILLTFTKMHVQPERLYFYLRFVLGIIHRLGPRVKNFKNGYPESSKDFYSINLKKYIWCI